MYNLYIKSNSGLRVMATYENYEDLMKDINKYMRGHSYLANLYYSNTKNPRTIYKL